MDDATGVSPLILTAEILAQDMAFFHALRQQHFPPARNYLQAHLTMFHHLPHDHRSEIIDRLTLVAAGQAPIAIAVTGLQPLGRGVAYRLSSRSLEAVRGDLASGFSPWLTPQDRQTWRPHITVQNKAEPDEAKRLLQALTKVFEPRTLTATGLTLWRYLGGPWQRDQHFPFIAPRNDLR